MKSISDDLLQRVRDQLHVLETATGSAGGDEWNPGRAAVAMDAARKAFAAIGDYLKVLDTRSGIPPAP